MTLFVRKEIGYILLLFSVKLAHDGKFFNLCLNLKVVPTTQALGWFAYVLLTS